MAIPAITREYTPGFCHNSIKPKRLRPHHEMRPDSLALHAEQFRVPNQTCKEPRFASWNTRESPGTLSQDKKNTDVSSGEQNSSVYSKSTRDEAHFPCIGSIAIPHFTSYTRSGLSSFRKLQRFPETPVSSLEEHQYQLSNSRKAPCTPYRLEMRADSLSSTEEVSQLSTSTSRGVFPQQ